MSTIGPRANKQAMQNEDGPSVLAIDDADLFGSELATIVNDVQAIPRQPTLILGMRSGRVDRVLNASILDKVHFEELVMPPLEDGDIGALLDVLDRENRLGALKGKSREFQHAAFRE